jgi:prepilin-type N-terminal cleavage/methylation domain-containing protein
MRARRPSSRAGFTLVEVLIVVGISTIGFVALADLQTSSIRGMKHMVRMYEATNLAENFIEDLRLEFSQWTPADPLAADATFPSLEGLPIDAATPPGTPTPGDGVTGGDGWVIGDVDGGADRRVSMVGDAHPLGYNVGIRDAMLNDLVPGGGEHFCLLYRLTWLLPNRAIRVEVEVQWPLETANVPHFVACDTIAANQLSEVRSITLTSTIMVNLFQR